MPAAKGNKYAVGKGTKTALQRFAEKCVFDYTTGCVLWAGGTTAGQGNSARYGAFWDAGPWKAHRWAAIHIHGIELGSSEAGHCCPGRPNTLCVEHLEGQAKADNIAERNVRVARERALGLQSAETRQFYLFKQLGILEPEPECPTSDTDAGIPYHQPPAWLRPYIRPPEANDDDCPF
jgi:hypothetical protein